MSTDTVPPRSCVLASFVGDNPNPDTEQVQYEEIVLTRDATLFRDDPDLSAQNDDLLIGTLLDGRSTRVLMQFEGDDNSILGRAPTTATLLCAEIGVAAYVDLQAPDIDMYPLTTADWGGRQGPTQSSATPQLGKLRTAQPGEATWDFKRAPDVPWNTPGGDIDFDTALSSELRSDGDPDGYYWYGGRNSQNMIGYFQDIIDGSQDNAGVALVERRTENSHKLYKGRFSDDPPKLFLVYRQPITPPPSPAPTPFFNPSSPNNFASNGSNKDMPYVSVILLPLVLLVVAIGGVAVYCKRRKRNQQLKRSNNNVEKMAADHELDLRDELDIGTPALQTAVHI